MVEQPAVVGQQLAGPSPQTPFSHVAGAHWASTRAVPHWSLWVQLPNPQSVHSPPPRPQLAGFAPVSQVPLRKQPVQHALARQTPVFPLESVQGSASTQSGELSLGGKKLPEGSCHCAALEPQQTIAPSLRIPHVVLSP
jgi:hypothetical protein